MPTFLPPSDWRKNRVDKLANSVRNISNLINAKMLEGDDSVVIASYISPATLEVVSEDMRRCGYWMDYRYTSDTFIFWNASDYELC